MLRKSIGRCCRRSVIAMRTFVVNISIGQNVNFFDYIEYLFSCKRFIDISRKQRVVTRDAELSGCGIKRMRTVCVALAELPYFAYSYGTPRK